MGFEMTALLLVAAALAGDDPASPEVRIGARAWVAMSSGWLMITNGSLPSTGTHMVVGSDIDLDPEAVPLLEARVGLGGSQGLGLSLTRIGAAGTRTADNAFLYHGVTFDAGRRVRAEADFLLLEADYEYLLNPGDPLRVTGHLGGAYWNYRGHVLTADALPLLDTSRSFDSAFWMAGLDLSWRPDPILELRALGAGAVERAHQNFFKVDAEALLRLSDSVGVSLGYRLHALRFRQSANQSNLKFHGPTLGLEISF